MADPFHYDPNAHHRRSMRLPGYDHSQAGLYFVTICTHNRINLFGEIGGGGDEWKLDRAGFVRAGLEPAPTGRMRLNPYRASLTGQDEYGEIVQNTWDDLTRHVARIELGEFVAMPNPIHGIVAIVGADSKSARTPAII